MVTWVSNDDSVSWDELSNLYRVAPLGEKSPDDLKTVFSNSRYKCFVYDGERLVGAGRALADGRDCSYICDVAVLPEFQGVGMGREIVDRLRRMSAGHKKIILYARPGTEGFYEKLGFRKMRTALAIFQDQARAEAEGLVERGR